MARGESGVDMETVRTMEMMATRLGFVERATLKWRKAFEGTPIIKQILQVKRFAAGLAQSKMRLDGNTEALEENVEQNGAMESSLTTVVAMMTLLTSSTELSAEQAEMLKMIFMRLGSTLLFIGGIIGIIVLVFIALVAVLADVNSPLYELMDSTIVLGELLNGFRIIIAGEDGESGLKGAFDVLILALIAGGLAWMVFGLPVAIVIGTIIAVIGIFRWAKGKTGSTVVGILAAGAVLVVGVGLLWVALSSTMTLGVAMAVALPVALILAGLALGWAAATGKVSAWWSIVAAAAVGLGLWFLSGLAIFAGFLTLPVIIIIAAVVLIIILIYRYRAEIAAFFVSVGNGIVSAWNWLDNWFTGVRTGIGDAIGDIVTSLGAAWSGFWTGVDEKWTEIQTSVGRKITWLVKLGRGFINTIKAGLSSAKNTIYRAIADLINAAWIDPINSALGFINSLAIPVPKWARHGPLEGVSSLSMNIGMLTRLAEGGIVTGPTPALIGEAGPEAVIPLDRAGGFGNTFNINLELSGIVAADDRAKRDLADEISKTIMREISDKIGSPSYRGI